MILPATHQLLTHNYQEMMRLLIAGIVALFYLSETSGECPNMDDIPVMYDKERFTCGCNYAINHNSSIMAVRVVEFSNRGYKIRIFCLRINILKENY